MADHDFLFPCIRILMFKAGARRSSHQAEFHTGSRRFTVIDVAEKTISVYDRFLATNTAQVG